MADSGIKKSTILKSNLPPVTSDNKYAIRYRIVSDDRNRSSHWSPIYYINAETVVPGTGDVQVVGNSIMSTWGDQAQRPSYDVFAKFNFEVSHKEISSNVAKMYTNNLSDIAVGSTILVEVSDAIFDGTHTVTAIDTVAKTISFAKTNDNIAKTGATGVISNNFVYHGTSSVHTYSMLAKTNAKTVEILVQVASSDRIVSSVLDVYQSAPVTL
jgi:hypothetical protein